MMEEDDFSQLLQSIKENGQKEPIIIFEDKILDGRNRFKACEELGIETEFEEWTEDDGPPETVVLIRNLHRRHLSRQERRKALAALVKAHPEKSDRALARTAKVSDKTVAAERKKQEATAEIPQMAQTVGEDGKTRTRTKAKADSESAPKAAPVDLPYLANVIRSKLSKPEVSSLCSLSAAKFQKLVGLLRPLL